MYYRKNTYKLFYKAIENFHTKKSLALAVKIQRRYSKIVLKNLALYNDRPLQPYNTIAGLDVSFSEKSKKVVGGIVILDKSLHLIEKKFLISDIIFPYIPGLLAFRELDIILKLLQEIQVQPEILCFDGQGIAHPRNFGIACYGGILCDIPTIGIAKSKLVGSYKDPDPKKGSFEKLIYRQQHMGWVFRSKEQTKPIFISPGWKIGLKYLPNLIYPYCQYRIPEPIRLAHNYVSEVKRKLNLV